MPPPTYKSLRLHEPVAGSTNNFRFVVLYADPRNRHSR